MLARLLLLVVGRNKINNTNRWYIVDLVGKRMDKKWSNVSPNEDENIVDRFVDSACSAIDTTIEKNFNLQKGLDFLATIALGMADGSTSQMNNSDELHEDKLSDTVKDNDDEDILANADLSHSIFLSPHDHQWITEPPPGTSKEFLDNIHPRDKRTSLAIHTSYCENIKQEELNRRRNEIEITRYFQTLQIQQLLQLQKHKQTKKQKIKKQLQQEQQKQQQEKDKKKSNGSDDTDVVLVDIPTCCLSEPDILRISIYEKFVRQYQFYYNAHDTEGMLTTTMLPYCSKDVVRQNCLWGMRPKVNPLTRILEQKLVVVDTTTYCGIQSFGVTFNMIFQRVPDAVIVYQQSRTKYDANMKITQIYTPFSIFCTVPLSDEDCISNTPEGNPRTITVPAEETNSMSADRKRKLSSCRMIELEATGYNLVQFNEYNQVILRLDNFFIKSMTGMTSTEPFISGETVWRAIWRR